MAPNHDQAVARFVIGTDRPRHQGRPHTIKKVFAPWLDDVGPAVPFEQFQKPSSQETCFALGHCVVSGPCFVQEVNEFLWQLLVVWEVRWVLIGRHVKTFASPSPGSWLPFPILFELCLCSQDKTWTRSVHVRFLLLLPERVQFLRFFPVFYCYAMQFLLNP